MEQHKAHNIYSAADIRHYLAGNMTPAEMHALEKAALDDPFLAEAIEGYESMPDTGWQPQLEALHNAFARRNEAAGTTMARVLPMAKSRRNWLRYAAALLITAGIATTIFLLSKDPATDPRALPGIAKNEVASPDTKGTIALPQTEQDSKTVSSSPTLKTDSLTVNTTTYTALKQTNLTMDSGFAFTPSSLPPRASSDNYWAKDDVTRSRENAAEELKTNAAPPVVQSFPTSPLSNNVFSNASPPPSNNTNALEYLAGNNTQDVVVTGISRQRKEYNSVYDFYNQQNYNLRSGTGNNQVQKKPQAVEMSNRFVGVVVGSDNNPLPFANINVKNQGFGTYADVNGMVRLVSADSTITIEVKSLGYKSTLITLNPNRSTAPGRIVLEEEAMAKAEQSVADNNLSKYKTVKPKGPVSRRAMLASRDTTENAAPEDGWANYNTYLTNNFNLPEEITKKVPHGEVGLSFEVDANGTISNITVNKSACKDCDALAKRLLEQGPQWKPKGGKKTKASVRIQF